MPARESVGPARADDSVLCTGPVRQSDDPALADLLWSRLQPFVPAEIVATVAPASEAPLRMHCWPEFQWERVWRAHHVDPRLVYESLQQLLVRPVRAGESRMHTRDADDRDEGWRPMLSVIVALGSVQVTMDGALKPIAGANTDASAEVPEEIDEGTRVVVALSPGDALCFSRGDPRHAHHIHAAGCALTDEIDAVVLHAKILYEVSRQERGL